MNFDYENLRLISWVLLIICLTGFALCDGLLSGISLLLPLVAKTPEQRRAVLDGIAPASLGQISWLLTVIAVLISAWPIAYAVFFSSMQILLSLLWPAYICRTLALLLRNAATSVVWRQRCDKVIHFAAIAIIAVLGLLCGNLLKGVPFHLDSDMRILFLGDIWGLLNPFVLLTTALTAVLLIFYAASFLQLQHGGAVNQESRLLVFKAGAGFLLLFGVAGLWITHLEGYHISSEIFPNGVSNPLNKFVKRGEGLWLDNYEHLPGLWAIPTLVCISSGAALYLTKIRQLRWAFACCSMSVACTIATAAISLFPFLLPSNRSLNSSLTLWDASASFNTLSVLLWVAAAALPLQIVLSSWVFGLRLAETADSTAGD